MEPNLMMEIDVIDMDGEVTNFDIPYCEEQQLPGIITEEMEALGRDMKYHNLIRVDDKTWKIETSKIKMLIEKYNSEEKNHTDGGLLWTICKENAIEDAEYLISVGTRVENSSLGYYPLLHAVENNSIELVKILLDAGADPNLSTNDDERYYGKPLFYAVNNNQIEIVKLLLDAGAKIYNIRDYASNCLQNAISENKIEIFRMLIKHEEKHDSTYKFYVLRNAIMDNQHEIVTEYLDYLSTLCKAEYDIFMGIASQNEYHEIMTAMDRNFDSRGRRIDYIERKIDYDKLARDVCKNIRNIIVKSDWAITYDNILFKIAPSCKYDYTNSIECDLGCDFHKHNGKGYMFIKDNKIDFHLHELTWDYIDKLENLKGSEKRELMRIVHPFRYKCYSMSERTMLVTSLLGRFF